MNTQIRRCFFAVCLSSLTSISWAYDREIALTIDDLPFVGGSSNTPGNIQRTHDRFMSMLQSLITYHVPATGFIIAGSIGKGQWELLEAFRNAGFGLGNHTYTHANLDRMSSSKYIEEIAKADQKLTPIMTTPKYFRYPYLAEGRGETKHQVQDYLTANQYTIAPVSIDSKDYQFNARFLHINWRNRLQHLASIKQQYLAYIWRQTERAEKQANGTPVKQILLVHANLLNSHCLGDIIDMYQKRGYHFISLNEALAQPATPTTVQPVPAAAPQPQKDPNLLTSNAHQATLMLSQRQGLWVSDEYTPRN